MTALQVGYKNDSNYSLQNNSVGKIGPKIDVGNFYFPMLNSTNNTLKKDAAEFSTSKKNKISSTVKIGIGFAVLGGIIGGIALFRGKINRYKPIKLAEHIDFQPAKTIDEAKEFAQKYFRISPSDYNVDNLEIANYVNEGFTNAVNVSRGKIVLPNEVDLKGGKTLQSVCTIPLLKKKILSINPEVMSPQEFCEGFQVSDMLKKEYTEGGFLTRLRILSETYDKNVVNKQTKFHSIYHELGHLNHEHQNFDLFKKYMEAGTGMDVVKQIERTGDLNPLIYQHIKDLKSIGLKTNMFGEYAVMYPNEFVAEIYAYNIAHKLGQPIMVASKDQWSKIMALYEKYGGPKIGVL